MSAAATPQPATGANAYRRGALLTKRRELMDAWAPHNTHADELADRL